MANRLGNERRLQLNFPGTGLPKEIMCLFACNANQRRWRADPVVFELAEQIHPGGEFDVSSGVPAGPSPSGPPAGPCNCRIGAPLMLKHDRGSGSLGGPAPGTSGNPRCSVVAAVGYSFGPHLHTTGSRNLDLCAALFDCQVPTEEYDTGMGAGGNGVYHMWMACKVCCCLS